MTSTETPGTRGGAGTHSPTHSAHPGLRPDSRLTPDLAERYVRDGSWTPYSLVSLLTAAAERHPDRLAAVGYRDEDRGRGGEPQRLTYAQLADLSHRLACGLADLGVERGDAVAVMLPNRVEFAALIFAINQLGAVYTGIPAAYGEREVATILGRNRAKVLVVPVAFRSVRHIDMVRDLRSALPALQTVVVAGEAQPLRSGEVPFERLTTAPDRRFPQPDPAALCHLGFTSGTTGEPKGVMNTSQTLGFVLRQFVRHIGTDLLGDPAVNLVGSPVGHHTGFLWGVLLSAYLEGTAVYLDRWDPRWARQVIRDEKVTTMFGAPTFLQDLARDAAGDETETLRSVVIAGAPVPRTLPEEAGATLGCTVVPAWGMTEWGIGIAWQPRLGVEALRTDGVPVDGCEVRIAAADGSPLPDGSLGDLLIRGPGLFLGYFERPDAMREEFVDGWFRTGDTAIRRPDGTIILHGRSKDIIIRGGENIPVVEVESLLYEHPEIVEAAVVGVPDPRLGERACAVIVPRAGARPDLEQLCDFLLDRGLSRHFLPERVQTVDRLPKTASGKIRKIELRARLEESDA